MRRKTWLVVVGVIGLALVIVIANRSATLPSADWVSADEFVLYSVDGREPPEREEKPVPVSGETLHGYPVLGKVAVDDPAERRRLADAFTAAASDKSPAKCFWPRHAVRLRHGDRTTEFIICFECSYVQVRADPRQADQKFRRIEKTARPAFDAPLAAAGVPIAPGD